VGRNDYLVIESIIVGHQGHLPIVAQRRSQGGVTLSAGRSIVTLSAPELLRLLSFVNGGTVPVTTVTTPAKARLA
jgi:hypothetical protein